MKFNPKRETKQGFSILIDYFVNLVAFKEPIINPKIKKLIIAYKRRVRSTFVGSLGSSLSVLVDRS